MTSRDSDRYTSLQRKGLRHSATVMVYFVGELFHIRIKLLVWIFFFFFFDLILSRFQLNEMRWTTHDHSTPLSLLPISHNYSSLSVRWELSICFNLEFFSPGNFFENVNASFQIVYLQKIFLGECARSCFICEFKRLVHIKGISRTIKYARKHTYCKNKRVFLIWSTISL